MRIGVIEVDRATAKCEGCFGRPITYEFNISSAISGRILVCYQAGW